MNKKDYSKQEKEQHKISITINILPANEFQEDLLKQQWKAIIMAFVYGNTNKKNQVSFNIKEFKKNERTK